MIAATTAARIEDYQAVAYKGTAQGSTFDELLQDAESLGANAVLSTCYDDAPDVDTLFHGAAAIVEPIPTELEDNFHATATAGFTQHSRNHDHD